jgi:hypothetical protein
MPSGNSHGERRRGAGRPRGALGRRGAVLRMSLASLARKYAEDAITTLATIMKDKGAPASARIRAATGLLNRGHGRPPQSPEMLTPFSQRPEFPTQEEINAELKRRGLLPVLELVAQQMEREDRDSREAEDPESFAQQGCAAPALTKTPTIAALQDDRIERDLEKSKSRPRPTRPGRYPSSRPRKKSTPS